MSFVPHEYRQITVDEFSNFLNAKGVSPTCSQCGHEDSAINISEPNKVTIATFGVADVTPEGVFDIAGDRGMGSATLACTNCGYMRAFHLKFIVRWLDQQQLGPTSTHE